MRPVRQSTEFSSFDVGTLIREDAAALQGTLEKSLKLLNKGILKAPYPLAVYPMGQVEEALRTMQQSRHLGKIVLSFSEENRQMVPVLFKAKDSLQLDPTATYLIVGDLGGLGRSLAREFVASGARHIAFVSLSGGKRPEAKITLTELEAAEANGKVFAADAADRDAFLSAMEQCAQQLPPVRGVVQMAMVIKDVVFENMSYEEWVQVMRPKVQGTMNLDQYFNRERPLDFMILCSSFSGVTGNVGQANYAAGNTYQDALAQWRRSQGLKAVSVNLGTMLDVGVLAEARAENNMKTWESVLGVREAAFHAFMKNVINGQCGKRGDEPPCPACRFGPLAVSTGSSTSSAGGEGAAGGASFATRLAKAAASKCDAGGIGIITDALLKKVAGILRIPPEEVDPSRPMYTYGIDSLVAREVRQWITR